MYLGVLAVFAATASKNCRRVGGQPANMSPNIRTPIQYIDMSGFISSHERVSVTWRHARSR